MITVEQPFAALPECVVVLSPQYAEATDVFSSFFVDGLCVWPFTGYLFGISRKKASTTSYGIPFSLGFTRVYGCFILTAR